MVATVDQFINHGWYSVREASLYTKINPSKLNRWLFGNKKGKRFFTPQFGVFTEGDKPKKIVTFLDMIQSLAIREIQSQHKVHPKQFRRAFAFARELGVEYPFARPHFTFLFGDELVFKFKDECPITVSKQRLFEFTETYLEDLTYDEQGLASSWKISEYKDVQIVIYPKVRFGEPVLPSGHTARSIWDAYKIEGSVEATAEAFDIPRNEVIASHKFFSDRFEIITRD